MPKCSYFFKFLPEEYSRRQAHDFLKFSFSAKNSPNFAFFRSVRMSNFYLFTRVFRERVEAGQRADRRTHYYLSRYHPPST